MIFLKGVVDLLSYQEYTLNTKKINGGFGMTLKDVFSGISKKNTAFHMNPDYNTIRYINENEYRTGIYKYVEPEFYTASDSDVTTPKFIIFSAPGATGKTALAQYISYTLNGIYWNLPDNKIAEYSFQGALTKSIGFNAVSDFVRSLQNGDSLLVIDAFDEAEAGSGRKNIEFFLRDLNEITGDCKTTCAILMARTESAVFIKQYFEKNIIDYKHYEVGYFTEKNSKLYIKNKLERQDIRITPVIENCMTGQFKEIHDAFDDKEANAFLGYAPVLDALAQTYVENLNTVKLLKDTIAGENTCKIMTRIFESLLERERSKFIKALQTKLMDRETSKKTSIDYSRAYSRKEQIQRIIGSLFFEDYDLFCDLDGIIPPEYMDDYIEVVNIQLPQHPFIIMKADTMKYDFTGPAFRDYAVAYSLADEDMHDFVKESLVTERNYYPSQMLIEFYELFSSKQISGKDIPLMYDSFRAHAHVGENCAIKVSGSGDDCFVEFILSEGSKCTYFLEFCITDLEDGIHFNQVNNCYVDVDGDVYIDNYKDEARISNSEITCNILYWNSDHVLMEAYSPGVCTINSNEFKSITASARFDLNFDRASNLKLFANNISSYYKLLAYKSMPVDENDADSFIYFATVVRRIFTCLRSHSKDTPARKMDFIDNKIVGENENKKKILKFLLKTRILYTDKQDWLYKLDTNKLGEFTIRWVDVNNGDLTTLRSLYDLFTAENIESNSML